MAKTLHSGNITFIDLTDTRKMDVHISSNLPTTQIYDANTLTHSPDWTSGNKLRLTLTVYADSTDITDDLTDIKWYRQVGSADKGDPIQTGSTVLTIATNELTEPSVGGTVGVISYSCVVTYNGKAAENQITFSRTDTGKNGTDGADGTSVNIKGTATSVTPVENTDYYTIVYSDSSITLAEEGDAYVYNGDLYVCVGLQAADGTDYFINVGRIQGPAGENAKNIILSGNSQVFRVGKSNSITPSTITVVAQTTNTSISNWTYSTNGGQTFISTTPAGVSRNGNLVTITGAALATNSIVIKASDGVVEDVFTVYKAFDGTDGAQGVAGQSASMAFLTNENVTFSANASGQILATSFSTNVVAYNGTTKVMPTVGTISNLPAGMTAQIGTVVNNEIPITFAIANNATLGSAISNNGSITIPVNGPIYTNLILSWSKVNSGAAGTSASLVDITPSALYFKSPTGKDGVFTPEYIYLYPRFQTVTFGKWEYSINGGTSWIAASGANGISIGTYNSISNTLRLARNSTLYTDTITSISFRCVGSNASVYDTVSIAKIYDVVDLQIGGRNLLTNSGYMENLDGWRSYTSTAPVNDLKLEANDVYGSVLTATGTAETSRIRVGKYIPYLQKNNRELTFSMIYSAPDSSLVTIGGKYSESDTTGEYGQFYGGIVKRIDLGNGFTYMECPVNLTYTEATRSFFVYIYPKVQTIKIVYCQLEDGHIATDWKPAPEDINTKTDELKQRVAKLESMVEALLQERSS